jgi:dTDP-L-rhamnose 4-epimerase
MDVCDAEGWDRVLAEFRPRAIVHLAAETGTGQSLELPVRHTHTNVTGTAALIEALHRAAILPEQILLSSSRAVYGEGGWTDPADGKMFLPGHRSREQLAAKRFAVVAPSGREGTPLPQHQGRIPPQPTSVYGGTKLAQEHLLSAWCLARDVPLSILRFQNVYGVGQSPHNPYTGIIGLFHRQAAGGERINVYEDGEIGRDFIYIDDIIRFMNAALQKPPAGQRRIDVGSGEVITILEAAKLIANIYDAPVPEISGAFRYGDVRWAVCDTQDLAAELGGPIEIDFAEGNRRLSGWLKDTGVISLSIAMV